MQTSAQVVLAIDPGNELSALVWFDVASRSVVRKMKVANERAVEIINADRSANHLAIEMAESFGAKVWQQVFVTVFWTGRLVQAWCRPYTLISRAQVKLHVAGSRRAKDPQIRNALLEMWGGKERAVGTKASPGPLHGVTADMWSALAIAVTFARLVPTSDSTATLQQEGTP